MPDERIHFTQVELVAEAVHRFGPDPKRWRFVCPACKDEATPQDFLDAGLDVDRIGQECIGRQLGALAKPLPTNTRGCDWCAYGLFRGPWLITMPDGKEKGSFRLAEVAEPWCNHDPAAVHDGVCECGHRVTEVPRDDSG